MVDRTNNEMLFHLNDKPPIHLSMFVAFQHLLAVFGGIITAPLIMAMGMGLSIEDTSYFVSSSLVVSGVATFIQIRKFGPLGSGLLSIQGTSFTFIGPIISAYFILIEGHSPESALGIIFGTCALCAVFVGVMGQFIERIQTVLTPNVTGTTVILIGSSLVWTTIKNLSREVVSVSEENGNIWFVILLAVFVFSVSFYFSRHKNALFRTLSITLGLLLGSVIAYFFGMLPFDELKGLDRFFVPEFYRFPLSFDVHLFVVLLPVFIISSVETVGDLTATSKLSGVSLGSKEYWGRIRGGISGDAFNSFVAALFCTFPNTSFSQNNGVIRLTGVSSRYVGRIVALMLCVLGLFPIVGGLFVIIPGSVLYGATLLMFIMVVISGLSIIRSYLDQDTKAWWVVIPSLIVGWGLPVLVGRIHFLPDYLSNFFSFPISTGAVAAIVLELIRHSISKKIWSSRHRRSL